MESVQSTAIAAVAVHNGRAKGKRLPPKAQATESPLWLLSPQKMKVQTAGQVRMGRR